MKLKVSRRCLIKFSAGQFNIAAMCDVLPQKLCDFIMGRACFVYVHADDLTDPIPATTFAHLDATIVLSKGLAAKGIYPRVDLLHSTSIMLQPRIVSEDHYEIAQNLIKMLTTCQHIYVCQE